MAAKFTVPLLDLDAIAEDEIDTADNEFFKRLYKNGIFDISSIMPPVKELAVFSIYGKQVNEVSTAYLNPVDIRLKKECQPNRI
jgi:hypothetical protein